MKVVPAVPPAGLFPLLNCFVHVIMYSYYALAALGPRVQKYLWWKKYLTQLQLAQFIIFAMYASLFFCLQTGYPVQGNLIYVFIGFPQPLIFFWLFYNFYKESYGGRKTKATKRENLILDENNNINNNYINGKKKIA